MSRDSVTPDIERVVATPERLEAAVYGDDQATHDLLMAAAEAANCWGPGSYELVMRPVTRHSVLDKQAYEDAREFQIAMEHDRRARNEAEGVLSLQAEAAEAWEAFHRHEQGIFLRWAKRWFR